MRQAIKLIYVEPLFTISVFVLIALGLLVLNSIAPQIFPIYYFYIIVSIGIFILFSRINFKTISAFAWHFYILSILFLIIPLIIGQITRGSIRWIPLGPITIQPSELVRPFLLIFFAVYVNVKEVSLRHLFNIALLALIPLVLILIQPSLGVSVITLLGVMGIVLFSKINKRLLISLILIILITIPLSWVILAPYQRQRVFSFINPFTDPKGSGYNSIQAMIAVGSGKIFGRGLGKGVQTQLAFLPERHTDFIFASVSEELGSIAAVVVVLGLFIILWRITVFIETANDETARGYLIGVFFVLLAECIIHIGMNMGLLPITGIPLPLVSAGGSALLATSISLAIAISASGLLNTLS